jgi:hypothetical protein
MPGRNESQEVRGAGSRGDRIVIMGHHLGQPDCEVLEVRALTAARPVR